MKISPNQHRPFGNTGLTVPPIMFGAAALGDARRILPEHTKLAICGEWFRHVAPPVFIDTGGNDAAADMALEVLGRALNRHDILPEEIVINAKFGSQHPQESQSIGYRRILDCWDKSCRLLGSQYTPRLASLIDIEEYLSAANSPSDRDTRFQNILDACRALAELKAAGKLAGIGVVAKDWRIANEIQSATNLDWVMLAGCFTIMRHPPELLEFLANLAQLRIAIVAAGIFHGGFLLGGHHFDGQPTSAENPADRPLYAWRKAFAALCHGHGIAPAHACIQFALSAPGVVAVALETSHPDRISENVNSVHTKVPDALWASMKEEGLLAESYR